MSAVFFTTCAASSTFSLIFLFIAAKFIPKLSISFTVALSVLNLNTFPSACSTASLVISSSFFLIFTILLDISFIISSFCEPVILTLSNPEVILISWFSASFAFILFLANSTSAKTLDDTDLGAVISASGKALFIFATK